MEKVEKEFCNKLQTMARSLEKKEGALSKYYDAAIALASEGPLNPYQTLKNSDYICQSDADINTYIAHNAGIHHGRFIKFFDELFLNTDSLKNQSIDLVIWACGPGLELLALFDQMCVYRQQGIYTEIRSIALVDASRSSLSRAQLIARFLFPNARLIPVACNLKTDMSNEAIRNFLSADTHLALTPRLHLFSNIIDLFDEQEVHVLAEKLSRFVGANESFIVFSPNYCGLSTKLDLFSSVFDSSFKEHGGAADSRANFWMCTTPWRQCDLFFKKWSECCSTSLLARKMRAFAEMYPKYKLDRLMTKSKHPWKMDNYDDVWLDSENHILYFIPKYIDKKTTHVLWVMFLGAPDSKEVKDDRKRLRFKLYDSYCQHVDIDEKGIKNESNYRICTWDCESHLTKPESCPRPISVGFDFHCCFYYQCADIKPLPSPRVKGCPKKQRQVLDKKDLLGKVRGGPGTGKSYILLWRAIETYKRTGLPVLIVSMTNSVVSLTERRLAALWQNLSEEEACSHAMIVVDTIKGVEYKHNKKMKHVRDDGDQLKFPIYGGVFIDEMQCIKKSTVSWLYDISWQANPQREFYVFCDEEQTLRDNKSSLVQDRVESNGKKVVPMPDVGFGRFITLNQNKRFAVKEILNLSQSFQEHYLSDYDQRLLKMTAGDEDGLLTQSDMLPGMEPVQFHKMVQMSDDYSDLFSDLFHVIEHGVGAMNPQNGIVFEFTNVSTIRKFVDYLLNKGMKDYYSVHNGHNANQATREKMPFSSLPQKKERVFYSTHVSEREYASNPKKADGRERHILKRNFYERRDIIHLTTVDSAQGHTFKNVIFIFEDITNSGKESKMQGEPEFIFTAISRAQENLYIVDVTQSQLWLNRLRVLYYGA